MTASVAVLNLLLGVVYLLIGTMIVTELLRDRRELGFSHFGLAFVALAFTCGPHHLTHGIHLAAEGGTGGALDLIAVAVGLPAGAIWVALRFEAFRGGRGDRFISGTPGWLMITPTVAGMYVTALGAGAIAAAGGMVEPSPGVLAGTILVGLYAAVAYFLVRTQIANRRPLGGWSLSGLALAAIFVTCALMHAIYSFYVLNGLYPADAHLLVIQWISVPAAMYFLWVVHSLYRGSFHDWNGAPGAARQAVRRSGPTGGGVGVPLPGPAGLAESPALAVGDTSLDARTSARS